MMFDKGINISGHPLHVDNFKDISPKSERPIEVTETTNYLILKDKLNMVEKDEVERAVSSLNDFIKPIRKNIKFELHDKLERYYVTVIDSSTKEVLKEIPPKKLLDMYAEMADFMGFLIDKKV
ncbi:flagellar protein FlaG [Oceanobacillus halophilus]|uniref:Flagellar protein FlaG n=1 Tax=Oceanobacillus halophilus TaxID=930130 RepID=A0A495A764_9BACI|nr:flagellar protein FlaG [Oceanobacillus halophilus]RKQ35573.1 flagellar protein FlaG [Oceanobacillus halophilus]